MHFCPLLKLCDFPSSVRLNITGSSEISFQLRTADYCFSSSTGNLFFSWAYRLLCVLSALQADYFQQQKKDGKSKQFKSLGQSV